MVDPDDGNLVAEGDVFLPVDGKKSAQGGMVQLFPPDLHVHDGVGPTVSKAQVGFTTDIEQILRTLTEPLKVVHNVSPEDVLANFEKWVPAIEEELGAIDHAVRKISGKETGLNTWPSNGAFQRLPTKLVFTVKPVDATDPSDPRTWYKRKARLVVCGNMAADSDEVTFSPTAAAELVRIALVVASQNKWQVGLLDVVAAFLKTPLQGPHAPRIAVQPPRVLQKAGMIPWGELWICRILTHALYGLRESPRLWSEYRDSLMAGLKFIVGDEEMYLVKGKIESSWWTIRDNQQRVHGIAVVCVDDVLVCSSLPVLRATAGAISGLWKTTDLAIITPGFPQRFLGMEVEVTSGGDFLMSQHGYIQGIFEISQHTGYKERQGALDKGHTSRTSKYSLMTWLPLILLSRTPRESQERSCGFHNGLGERSCGFHSGLGQILVFHRVSW